MTIYPSALTRECAPTPLPPQLIAAPIPTEKGQICGGTPRCFFWEHLLGGSAVDRGVEPVGVRGLMVEHTVPILMVDLARDILPHEVLFGAGHATDGSPRFSARLSKPCGDQPSLVCSYEQVLDQSREGLAARLRGDVFQVHQLAELRCAVPFSLSEELGERLRFGRREVSVMTRVPASKNSLLRRARFVLGVELRSHGGSSSLLR